MGIKCIYTWSIPLLSSIADELDLIHNHLVHTLHASPVTALPNASLLEHNASCKDIVLPNNIAWYRVCQVLKHSQPTISGTGGGVSREITEPYLRGLLGLQDIPDPITNPRHVATSRTRPHPSTCYRVVSSDLPGESIYVTPVCPAAKELATLESKLDTRTVLAVTGKLLARPTETNAAQEAAKKVALLKYSNIVAHVDNSMRSDVFRCDSTFDAVVNRTGSLQIIRSLVLAGNSYLYKDFMINIASIQNDGLDRIVVEIEYMAGADMFTDPLQFTVLLNTVVPQSSSIYFREANTTFSPCYDYDAADANLKNSEQDLDDEAKVLTMERSSDIGLRISLAHLAAPRIFGVEPDAFYAEHAALQYIQLAQHF